MDPSGNLYGTTLNGGAYGSYTGFGTVFELKPPTTNGGQWTESVLWNFGNGTDGYALYSGLVIDNTGNLYGTTSCGGAYGESQGGDGTVFQLIPPSTGGGSWTESILWNFGNGTDGASPIVGLIMDKTGNLYGTTGSGVYALGCGDGNGGGTHDQGTAFELTPPSSIGENWTESVLWNFDQNKGDTYDPAAELVMDANGNLYGAGSGGAYGGVLAGTVFEISTLAELIAAPVKLNFGNIKAAATSKPKKVTLTNKSLLAAEISDVTAAAPFMIAGRANTCSGETIAPKKTCSFEVEFSPTAVGKVTDGSIDVTYNGTSPAVTLEGNGVAK